MFRAVKKLTRLLARYPDEPGVGPQAFAAMEIGGGADQTSLLTFQSVSDKFYFLLFGAIRARLSAVTPIRTELVVVRAVSGAVGAGWLAELKRSALVAWLWTSQWVRAYGPMVDSVGYRCSTWAHPVLDLMDWFRARVLWRQLQRQPGHVRLQIRGIEVGDLIVDSYLRFRPAPKFDISDIFVRRLIWQALRDVRNAQSFFGTSKPRWYLTSYTTYLEHGIPARVALAYGTEVRSFGNLNCFGKRLTQQDSYHTRDFSGYRSIFDGLDRQESRLSEARQQLEMRLSGGIDAAISYMEKSAYANGGQELPAGLSGAAVIFLHDFYDSPHTNPDMVFDDFWQWVTFTIKIFTESGVGFFVKPHPNQIALSDEALKRLKADSPGLKFLTGDVSNCELVKAGISCGITMYGTVAHELAYMGVPTIACARHPHHSFDFCRTARTLSEYRSLLETYKVMPISKEEMQRQALAFYYVHNNLHLDRDERELQQAYATLWRACNVGVPTADKVMAAYTNLVHLPAFNRFVMTLASGEKKRGIYKE